MTSAYEHFQNGEHIMVTGPDGRATEVAPGQSITLSWASETKPSDRLYYEDLADFIAAQG